MIPEDLFTLADAAQRLPGQPHISTLHRWRLRGCRGFKLTTWLVGGRRYTSQTAIDEFIAATSAASVPPTPSASDCTLDRVRRAEQYLEQIDPAYRSKPNREFGDDEA